MRREETKKEREIHREKDIQRKKDIKKTKEQDYVYLERIEDLNETTLGSA